MYVCLNVIMYVGMCMYVYVCMYACKHFGLLWSWQPSQTSQRLARGSEAARESITDVVFVCRTLLT